MDGDDNGMLTYDEFCDNVRELMIVEELKCPETHLRIFHAHLTFFQETGENDPCVYPSQWTSAFDLLQVDFIPDIESVGYYEIFQRAKRAIVFEQLATVILRRLEKDRTSLLSFLALSESLDSGPPGQKWKEICKKPTSGIEIENEALAAALQQNPPAFTLEQIDSFKIAELSYGSYIKVGDRCFSPADGVLRTLRLDMPLDDLHWQLSRQFGDATPKMESGLLSGFFPQPLSSAVSVLRHRMATRGVKLLAILAASHQLTIDKAYETFSGQSGCIRFPRFKEIMRRLAPEFVAARARVESLFLFFCRDVGQSSSADLQICKEMWHTKLSLAASYLRSAQFRKVLGCKTGENTSSGLAEGEGADASLQGERQRVRELFLEHAAAEDAKQNTIHQSCLFINRSQLKLSLAKVGVARRDAEAEAPAPKRAPGVQSRRGRGRGEYAAERSIEERMEDLRNDVTLWDLEREVERSRLSSTFEQIRLHEIFGDALCDHLQPQKGVFEPYCLLQHVYYNRIVCTNTCTLS